MEYPNGTAISNTGASQTIIRQELSVYDYIVAPVLVNNNHWCVLFIKVRTCQVLYLNPSGETNERLQEVLLNWIKFCSTRKKLQSFKWKLELLENLPVQKDNYNCGIFVCYYVNFILTGYLGNHSMDEYRKNMLDTFKSKSVITKCCICHKFAAKGKSIKFLTCSHFFHKECLKLNNILERTILLFK